MMKETLEAGLDAIGSKVPMPENSYMGADGFLHCSVCHVKIQTRVVIEALGIDKIVPCTCGCKMKEIAAEEMRKKQLTKREMR